MNVEEIEKQRIALQQSLESLVRKIGKVQIGKKEQFPYGWRKSAKGRTVWRILEELITQNLEKHHEEFGLTEVTPSPSEVSVYDMECKLKDCNEPIYINIKSANIDGKTSKDDISKGEGLVEFYKENPERSLFIATFWKKRSIPVHQKRPYPFTFCYPIAKLAIFSQTVTFEFKT
jgi:hypothetical protein